MREVRLCVFVGDKVLLQFDFLGPDRQDSEVKARVLEVTPRYGRINRGKTPQNSLLKIKNCDTGEERYVDSSYVVSILERPSKTASRPPRNIFSNDWIDPKFTKTERKGIICGPLAELAATALRGAHFFLPHSIDPMRLAAIYEKQNIGLVREEHFLYWVHKKPFVRWARQNASRICETTAERTKKETAMEHEFEEDYWKGVNSEYEVSGYDDSAGDGYDDY